MKKLNMKKLWKMAEKRVPNRVVQTVKQYKRGKETYYFLPFNLEYKDEIYYCVQYEPTEQILVVREDGTVPYYDEAKKVIELSARVAAANAALNIRAEHLLRTRTIQTYRHILSLLEKIEKELKDRLSTEIREDLETFRQVSKYQIEKRREMEDAIARGREVLEKVFQEFRVTEEDIKEMRKLQLQLGKAMYDRNQAQLRSFEKRERLMRALIFRIPPWKILTWMRYLILLFYHRNMMNRIRPEDKKPIQEMERAFRGEYTDSDIAILHKMKRSARNPKKG
jgi:hypothetical protein